MKDPKIKFESSYTIDTKTQCWCWNKELRRGYGTFWTGKKRYGAHRWAAQLAELECPDGSVFDISSRYLVCHKCNNRSCVNPAHLYVGTHSDNTKQAIADGRFTQHERNWPAKYDDETIRAIKDLLHLGYRISDIARITGLYRQYIMRVRDGKLRREIIPRYCDDAQ